MSELKAKKLKLQIRNLELKNYKMQLEILQLEKAVGIQESKYTEDLKIDSNVLENIIIIENNINEIDKCINNNK